MLIASQKYFLLHAPRQTGKTSALLEMMEALNLGDTYHAAYANIEGAQVARNNIESGIDTVSVNVPPDDQSYVEDLGLIVSRPQLKIANRIYREIIPRELTWVVQSRITQQSHWFISEGHRLDMSKLLNAFQQFFREHSKSWIEQFQYKEAGPQLLMQAFLQRIINGGGRINREYALDRKRTDLTIEWPLDEEQGFFGPVQRIVIELKIRYGVLDTVIARGLEQTSGYADSFGAEEAYLIVFNRDPETLWEEKIWQRTECFGTRKIGVWGM
jgi:hypothetical protein